MNTLGEVEERQVKVKLPKLLWELLDATESEVPVSVDEWVTSVVCKRILHLIERVEAMAAAQQQKETTQ